VGRSHWLPISPPLPQGIGGLRVVGGIPVGSDDGSAPWGRFWSTAHDLGGFQSRVATLGVGVTALAVLLGVRRRHLLRRGGRGPSLRVGAASFHGGGGVARRRPVKRRPPCEVVRMVWQQRPPWWRASWSGFFLSGYVSASTVLAMDGGSRGEPRWHLCVVGRGGEALVGLLGAQCAK
jgi:hypothetical protein